MPIQFNEENDGKTIVVHVSGKLTRADYKRMIPEVERVLRERDHLRILYDMTDFHGWEFGAVLEGLEFDFKHIADLARIERCAMVGEEKWHSVIATLCKPFTKTTLRYFDHTDAAAARKWLDEP